MPWTTRTLFLKRKDVARSSHQFIADQVLFLSRRNWQMALPFLSPSFFKTFFTHHTSSLQHLNKQSVRHRQPALKPWHEFLDNACSIQQKQRSFGLVLQPPLPSSQLNLSSFQPLGAESPFLHLTHRLYRSLNQEAHMHQDSVVVPEYRVDFVHKSLD